jgi:protein-L-isoaspartate(D-aspartate) O-methyltransferase
MNAASADLLKQRLRMVQQQIRERGIRDPAVLAAMEQVPREEFVASRYREYAYDDGPLPILEGQTISQPYVVGLMCQSLELGPEDRVLEIGTGSGYAAAVLSLIAGEVHTVERLPSLVQYAQETLARLGYDNVHVHLGDGTLGWPAAAPYNGIIVAAGGPDVPETLKQQLAPGGRLVIPIGSNPRSQRLVRIWRQGEDKFSRDTLGYVRFVPLIGQEGWSANVDD